MITDFETNAIYFSKKLAEEKQLAKSANSIFEKLESLNISYQFLPKTNDIWARDYMPVQVSESKFIEYRYDPDYLQGNSKDYRNLKTYPDLVCDAINIKTEKSDLILDGGNVVKSKGTIILTDKVVIENRHIYSKQQLISKLQETFDVDKVILIPWDKAEEYGHSDGMLRFIDDKTVLINGIYKIDSVLLYRLRQNKLSYEFLDLKVKKPDKNNWAYINFLQTKDLILLPKLNIEEDLLAFEQISTFFPDYARKNRIEMANMTEVVDLGGALNCITWTIKK